MKFSSKKSKFLLMVVVVILLVFLLNVFQKDVREFFYWFSAPIQKVLWTCEDTSPLPPLFVNVPGQHSSHGQDVFKRW